MVNGLILTQSTTPSSTRFKLRWLGIVLKCFSQKILLEGQSGPGRPFLGANFFREGANKLKAKEGKIASGYHGEESSYLGSMIKFNIKCFLKCFYTVSFESDTCTMKDPCITRKQSLSIHDVVND